MKAEADPGSGFGGGGVERPHPKKGIGCGEGGGPGPCDNPTDNLVKDHWKMETHSFDSWLHLKICQVLCHHHLDSGMQDPPLKDAPFTLPTQNACAQKTRPYQIRFAHSFSTVQRHEQWGLCERKKFLCHPMRKGGFLCLLDKLHLPQCRNHL